MKTSTIAAVLSTTIAGANAWKGFNVAAQKPNGECKTQDDWRAAFDKIKSFPGGFDSVRVYASSDCNTLQNAIPAAQATGLKLLAGVWAEDENHFEAEKQALLTAIQQYGNDWMAAVSVGSEDLYRAQKQDTKETTPWRLAEQIYDVRGMIRSVGANQQVGHVDTWDVYVDGQNNDVIKACEFIGLDSYPYWQNVTIDEAVPVFWEAVGKTQDAVNAVNPDAKIWITETSWPVSGPEQGAAHPSVENSERYWKEVGCPTFAQKDTFWYIDQDYQASPAFGVLGSDNNLLIDLNC